MSNRYLVIHGHFYQPPRENPWIMAIEPQDSAAPFADWNLRVNRECYSPNTQSRLMDSEGRIKRLVNNYEYLSFNFGPTLLSWMEKADPVTYGRIIKADRKAAEAKNGHGPALAQVYNHIIMPLANEHDRLTQIRWGLTDFETRFGRRAEGLWLAETAVDLTTLKMLSAEGLKFTILSQTQARAVRRPSPAAGEKAAAVFSPPQAGEAPRAADWLDVSGGRIDPREPYRVFWGDGPDDFINVFFYDGPVSRAIAFEKLLTDGTNLLRHIEEAFGEPKEDGAPRLVNLATDGESYGHHFTFGDMALSWLFDHLEKQAAVPGAVRLTNYGEYLSMFPPVREARIFENTSWSCAHGIERWRSDCGCNTGGGDGGWNQKWRAPLREGLDWLRDQLSCAYEAKAGRFFKDPWRARDDYIRVIIADYDEAEQDRFFERHQKVESLSQEERSCLLELLESQLMSLYMFTSCAWFFDDISGLEPTQNMRYALRAIELAQLYTGVDLASGFLTSLAEIKPNVKKYKTGLDVWRSKAAPGNLTGRAAAAHWAAAVILDARHILSLFNTPRFSDKVVTRLTGQGIEILAGVVEVFDRRVRRAGAYRCLAIYSGGAHLAILVEEALESDEAQSGRWLEKSYLSAALGDDLSTLSTLNIWAAMVRLMPKASRFVMEELLPHCRSALLSAMVSDIYEGVKNYAGDAFHLHQHLLLTHRASGRPADWIERFMFRVVGESELKRILGPADFGKPVNMAALSNLLNRRGLVGISRDEPVLAETAAVFFRRAFEKLPAAKPAHRLLLEIFNFVKLIKDEGFTLNLWEMQNAWQALKTDPSFNAGLSAEESGIMDGLGLLLGFAPQTEDDG
ncbi:MAG: DUF3536 domain-containing protein [Candidatus Adiutrix sp.]|nr:DUF3536 domain-containing protein [Candidatus Adiutrix sp.]